MKKILTWVVLFALIVSVAAPYAAFGEDAPEKRVIITYKTSTAAKASTKNVKVRVHRTFNKVPAAALTASADEIEKLKQDPNVLAVEEDKRITVKAQTLSWGMQKINAPAAWSSGITGKGVKVAVLDTGIATDHPDLTVAGGVSIVSYTTDYNDDEGHGTHVAGIIAARDNTIGVKGVAPNVSLYAIKAFDSTGSAYISDVIAGLEWAITNKMDIVNMSIGADESSAALKRTVDQAYQNGMLLVAAAGNDGTALSGTSNIDYPAVYSSVIAATATNERDTIASFSSTGAEAEVAAPGNNIVSTCPGASYCTMSGTSMAAPFVSGYLALLKQANPSMTNVQLRGEMAKSVRDLGAAGRDVLYGYGLVQYTATAPIAPSGFQAVSTDNSVKLSWTGDGSSYTLSRDGAVIYTGIATSFEDKGLKEATTYNYSLYASKSGQNSSPVTLSVATKQRIPVVLQGVTYFYNKIGDTKPAGSLAPQTVYAFEQSGDWYHIHTWLGDKWLRPISYPKLTLFEVTPMYDAPNTGARIASYLGPQTVQTIGSDGDWYLINTWLGSKWVSSKRAAIGEPVKESVPLRFDETTALYDGPFSDAKISSYIGPQKITAFESWNGWYHVRTWLGNKWVSSKHAITGDVVKESVKLRFDETTALYESPFPTARISSYIGPQTVTSFESWNGWYRIRTWLGDRWVSSKHAITGDVSKQPVTLYFAQTTALHRSPFATSKVSGYMGAQAVTAFESWNSWYRISTWLGHQWVSGQRAQIQ